MRTEVAKKLSLRDKSTEIGQIKQKISILNNLPEIETHLSFVDYLDVGCRQVGDQLVFVSLSKNINAQIKMVQL